MRQCVSSNPSGYLHLTTGDQRPTHRGTEEVFTPVDRASAEGGPHELFHEFLAQVFDVALIGPRCDRLGAHSLELFALTDISGNADYASAVALLEPGDDYGCIEPAGVGEGN